MKFAGWFVAALCGGFFSALFFWEADVAWLEQGFTFGFMFVIGVWGWWHTRVFRLHHLYRRDNPGIGLVQLSVWVAMAWCVFTIFMFGSERIVHIWYGFYLIIGYGAIMLFGMAATRKFGLRMRIDVFERKNFAAAIVIAAFMLSTGMIYGGSMWGESDAQSLEYGGFFEVLPSYDDGWWIIMWFFLMGWVILFATMKLWFARERTSGEKIRRDRSIDDARAAGLYCLGCAIPITDAVAGDYHGLADSFISFGVIAFPVLAHEFFRPRSSDAERNPNEPWLYIVFGIVAIVMSRPISTILGFR